MNNTVPEPSDHTTTGPLFTVEVVDGLGVVVRSDVEQADLDTPERILDAAQQAEEFADRLRALASNERAVPAPRLPFWWPADRTHPGWCQYADAHAADTRAADRRCYSESATVNLTLADPIQDGWGGTHPDFLAVGVEQQVTDAAPVVRLSVAESSTGRSLTAAEARRLAAVLLAAVEQAEDAR